MARRRTAKVSAAKAYPELTFRDHAMARLAAARALAQSAVDACDDAINMFLEPEEDEKGIERAELIEAALESAGAACRALEACEEVFPHVDKVECEPWDEEGEEEEEASPS